MRSARIMLVAALTVSFGACGSSTAPRSPLDGAWLANLPGQTLLDLRLTVSGTSVSGTGVLGSLTSTSTTTLTVSGGFVTPDVTLSIAGGAGTMTFVGTLGSSRLVGTLSGAGYTNATVTFAKH